MKHLAIFKFSRNIIAAILLLLVVQPAMARGGIEVGILTCKSMPGTRMNFIVHSSTLVECVFTHPAGEEKYNGEIGMGFGVDLNVKTQEQSVFTVFSISEDVTPEANALAGTYIGGRASAAFGIGAGAAVLIGGGAKNFSLQPIGLETNTGIGAAMGLGYLTLD